MSKSEKKHGQAKAAATEESRDPATRAADAERDALVGLHQAMLDAEQCRSAAWRRSVEAMENGWKS